MLCHSLQAIKRIITSPPPKVELPRAALPSFRGAKTPAAYKLTAQFTTAALHLRKLCLGTMRQAIQLSDNKWCNADRKPLAVNNVPCMTANAGVWESRLFHTQPSFTIKKRTAFRIWHRWIIAWPRSSAAQNTFHYFANFNYIII